MNANASYDVLVIGGGASGLAAAITAARAGKSTCIVERDVACGLKLLATGNGRCNLSNDSIDFQRYNHPAFVESVMGRPPRRAGCIRAPFVPNRCAMRFSTLAITWISP